MEALKKREQLLNPVDRVGEILFGVILTLSFTCTVSVTNARETEIRQLLIAAVSCNLAWGTVDAIMYLVSLLVQRRRNKTIFENVRSMNTAAALVSLKRALPASVVSVLTAEEIENLRDRLNKLPDDTVRIKLSSKDLKRALALFVLVVVSTFPVVAPFIFIQDAKTALRLSNLIALAMMFWCGWSVAAYVGFKKWRMSMAMVLLGIVLVFITVSLGG